MIATAATPWTVTQAVEATLVTTFVFAVLPLTWVGLHLSRIRPPDESILEWFRRPEVQPKERRQAMRSRKVQAEVDRDIHVRYRESDRIQTIALRKLREARRGDVENAIAEIDAACEAVLTEQGRLADQDEDGDE